MQGLQIGRGRLHSANWEMVPQRCQECHVVLQLRTGEALLPAPTPGKGVT